MHFSYILFWWELPIHAWRPRGYFWEDAPKDQRVLILEPRDTMFLDLVGLGATRDASVGRSVLEMKLGLPVHEGGVFPSNP